jgi:hypothetical protein
LPQILAGGALGQDPLGAVSVDVGVGALVVVVGVVVGDGTVLVVVGEGAVVVVVGDAVVGGAVGDVVVVVGEGAAVVVVGGVGVGVVLGWLSTVKDAERVAELRADHRRTAVMVCGPSASFSVSYGCASRSVVLPAKSNGGAASTRTGGRVRPGSSR